MLAWGVFFSIGLGWCLGGRLSRFEGAGLKWFLLPAAALLLQFFAGRLAAPCLPGALLLCSYLLIFIFLFKNRHLKKTALLLGGGSLCNLAVILANGFRMPVSARVLELLSAQRAAALLAGEIFMYSAADEGTRLLFLGDILYVSPLGGFLSVGDFLLILGVFFCLMAAMAPSRAPVWLTSG